jgi:hypothetical protein
MRTFLIGLFSVILMAMVAVTTVASMERSIFDAGRQLLPDRWFQATLCDAYFGFITFFVWVAYKERAVWKRSLWFILIMCLGNIAMATYMLIQLVKLPPGAPLSALLSDKS